MHNTRQAPVQHQMLLREQHVRSLALLSIADTPFYIHTTFTSLICLFWSAGQASEDPAARNAEALTSSGAFSE